MLGFFPVPYPDELLYSTIARYHVRSGNRSFRGTHIELFGSSVQRSHEILLPQNVVRIVENLPDGFVESVSVFIWHHTLYPFHTTFLTDREVWSFEELMRKSDGRSFYQLARLNSKAPDFKPFLQFCPVCLTEDMQSYGEGYWHRLHQTPGVVVCTKHGVALQNSSLNIYEADSIHYCAANQETCPVDCSPVSFDVETLSKLLCLAEDIERLFDRSISFKGLPWLHRRYQEILTQRGFLKKRPRSFVDFDSASFMEALLEFYGAGFMETVRPGLTEHLEASAMNCLLACDLSPSVDRLLHILLIRFLVGSLLGFFEG